MLLDQWKLNDMEFFVMRQSKSRFLLHAVTARGLVYAAACESEKVEISRSEVEGLWKNEREEWTYVALSELY